MQETEQREALTRALLALKLLNDNYASEIAEKKQQRLEHSNLNGISFFVGQVRWQDCVRGVTVHAGCAA